MRPTALYRLYRALSAVALPFAARTAVKKLRKAGVPVARAHERLGHATIQRPLGRLIWFHGASVGEAKSILPLVARIRDVAPDVQVLLTSGTATSAEAVAPRLPDGAVHQFSPLDGIGALDRFLTHWRPDLCVLVESELWPNLLDTCAARDLPVALLNARLSDRSAAGWKKYPDTAAYILRGITWAHCQDRRSRDHLRDMGLATAEQGTNLKSIQSAPRLTSQVLDAAHNALAGRPIWVAASTHPGEEEQVLAAHRTLLEAHPNLCLILVPRHPERANDILTLIGKAGLSVAQRSSGDGLDSNAQVYLADTMGETDLWYALSPIVFLGGSFSDVGGHTPFEPAAAHTAILHGPNYANFAEAYAAFKLQDASVEVRDSTALADEVDTLLTHPSRAAQLANNARPLAPTGTEALDQIAQRLFSLMDDHGMDRHA
ncbi:3-deoxy-D-manno-octulosonic acid transferase [Tateyamaria omphalii]|uniref:3-deoxy-D-manno-octulosonic acid transferase n=1 Tax=Tateyamaria omphalii TaxID=299262 RepID=UPI001C995DCB|nr:3-deoxy-D-manno-octulosonic acid transferase [Tateyamaria omphalii]MBY5932202.1 3-deoxy-D-manno-octulosonic acid transferase [Tateyamaria omphalii]